MQFEGLKRNTQAPNLTPLIDMVFLLLVFFLLTSNFVKEQVLDIQLPQAQSGQEKQDDILEIVLDAENHIHVDGQQVQQEYLALWLETHLRGRHHKAVRLRGDQSADLQHITIILDAARKAGASGMNIITEQQ